MVVRTEERFKAGCSYVGISVIKSGLPDFIIEKDGRVLFVEIKSKEQSELSIKQFTIFSRLQQLGFDIAVCYDGDIECVYRFDSWFGNDINNYFVRDTDPDYKGKKPERINLKEVAEISTILKIRLLPTLRK